MKSSVSLRVWRGDGRNFAIMRLSTGMGLAWLSSSSAHRIAVRSPTSLAVLDVGLDQIARLAGAAVALLALGKLGDDEFGGGALRHLLVEARDQFVEQHALAEQKARFEDAGADGEVGLGLADAFGDRAR